MCVTTLYKSVQMDTITQEQAFAFPKNEKTTVLLNFCNTKYQHDSDHKKEKKNNLCTEVIYHYQLPKYLYKDSLNLRRLQNGQDRRNSCHRVYQQMKTYQSFFNTSYGLNLPSRKVESLAFYSPAATPDLVSIRSLITTSPAVHSSSCAHNSAMFLALCDTTVT